MHEPAGFCLVLHAHLPYVRHPEHGDFLEEDWLFEAISETYLPLLDLAERLLEEGVPYHFTLSVTPTSEYDGDENAIVGEIDPFAS